MKPSYVLTGQVLSIGYRLGGGRQKRVHDDLSFGLRAGELTSLLGPNGAGKSTLLKTLCGSQTPFVGDLMLFDKPFASYTTQQRSRMIGVVLTDKTYAGGLRVHELVTLGRHPYTGFFGRLDAEDRRVSEQAMGSVGISDKADCYVAELSDGERQKVMIAKVLTQQCPVILLDEPTAFLDVTSRIEVMNLLHRLSREEGKTILLSTHDIEQALLLSDRLWLISRERGLLYGTTEDLILDNSLNDFFSRNEISFDKNYGSFRYTRASGQTVGVVARGGELLQWSCNALLRNGYTPSTDIASQRIILQIDAADDISFCMEGEPPIQCRSFDEWIQLLNQLGHA